MTVAHSRLKNGITVVSHHMPHLESVALGLWVGAGVRSEAAEEHGISHLLEHMAFKGTGRRSARDIAEAIEAVGGEMNAETTVDHTSYYVRLLKDDLALGLDVLGDIICDPLLDADELALEQHVVLQEIGAAYDVAEDWVFDLFQQAAFPDQSIGRSVMGTPQSVSAHTRDDLQRFLGAHYCGPGMVLSGAGNLEHDTLVKLAERHFDGLPASAAPAWEAGSYQGGESLEARPVQEAQILIGFAGPSYTDPDFAAAHLLSSILGGGMASRLFQELRETRGLCYSIYSFYWPFTDTGLFGIQTATSEEDIKELVPVLLNELAKMTDGVTQAELQRAKAQLKAGLLMTLESPIARAGQMARHILIHDRLLQVEETLATIDAVTADDLAALAAGSLASAPTLAAVGPVDSLPRVGEIASQLADRGQSVSV